MRRLKAILTASAAACVLPFVATVAQAEEIEHKFRLAFSGGGYSTTDQQHSNAANVRVLVEPDGSTSSSQFSDPRNDSGAFSDFGFKPNFGGVLSASYGFNRLWYVEASLGYRRGKVGNVQLQAMFDGVETTTENPNNYSVFNLDGGTITQIPVQLTAGIRFRPKKSFNPYICAGIGYSFNSFKPSAQINELSLALDESVGGFARLDPDSPGSVGTLEGASSFSSLKGIKVDARSVPEWHFGGGLEYTFARRWTFFVDGRYAVYSGKFEMSVNGSDELGISVPGDTRVTTDPDANGPFGGIQVVQGGLIDGGMLVPLPDHPEAQCELNRVNCVFDKSLRDGKKDTGFYYIQAGKIRYDAASYQLGFKFTF